MSAAEAREQAREILDSSRYTGTDVPRPFERPLDWLGDRLEDLGDELDGLLPGGDAVVWAMLAATVLVVAVLVAQRMVRRSGPAGYSRALRGGAAPLVDPAELERAAVAAERDGDWEAAVRLRFRAGVLRLSLDDSLTTGEIAAALQSRDFDLLGADFDSIAYGGRPASEEDARAARSGWERVLP